QCNPQPVGSAARFNRRRTQSRRRVLRLVCVSGRDRGATAVWLGAAVALLAVAALLSHIADGSKASLAVVLGAVAVCGSPVIRRRAAAILAIVVVIVMAGAPLIPTVLSDVKGPWTTSQTPSVTHRMLIWRFVSDRIAERPVLGWGLNSSRAIPGGKDGPMPG